MFGPQLGWRSRGGAQFLEPFEAVSAQGEVERDANPVWDEDGIDLEVRSAGPLLPCGRHGNALLRLVFRRHLNQILAQGAGSLAGARDEGLKPLEGHAVSVVTGFQDGLVQGAAVGVLVQQFVEP